MKATKQQTAVEWLVEKLDDNILWTDSAKYILNQAKAMEKEQIINAFWNGDNTDCLKEQNSKEFAEQYYTETYETKNQ